MAVLGELPVIDGSLFVRGTIDYSAFIHQSYSENKLRFTKTFNNRQYYPKSEDDDANNDDEQTYLPRLIAQVHGVDDVVTCLKYARQHSLQVTVKSGGHSWFGSFLQPNVILLDLSQLDSIEQIDDDNDIATLPESQTSETTRIIRAAVGPSVTGDGLQQSLFSSRLSFPSGHCAGVTLGGFLLGGGYGWFSDYYGLASNSVLGFTVVTARGECLDITDSCDRNSTTMDTSSRTTTSQNDDWMWLARGAGPAFPGVVTSFKLQLHPLPAILRLCHMTFPIDDFSKLLDHCCSLLGSSACATTTAQTLCKVEVKLIITCMAKEDSIIKSAESNHKTSFKGKLVCILSTAHMADSLDEFQEQHDLIWKSLMEQQLCKDKITVEEFEHFGQMSQACSDSYPSSALHQAVTSSVLDLDHWQQVDWMALVQSFDKAMTSLELYHDRGWYNSHILIVVGNKLSSASQLLRDGAYGPHAMAGLNIHTYGLFCPNDEDDKIEKNDWGGQYHNTAQKESRWEETILVLDQWIHETMTILVPHLVKFNVLEHPLNSDTFDKTFRGTVGEKLQQLRQTSDPDGVFVDPNNVVPPSFHGP